MTLRIFPVFAFCLSMTGPVLFADPSSTPTTIGSATAGSTGSGPAAVNAVTAQQRKAAVFASKPLFKSGDIAGGEAALFATNHYASGTVEGYRESGARLITMAFLFHQEGDAATATKVAKAALDELEKGRLAAAGDPQLDANICTEIGFLHEHLYGTRQQAEADYQTAIKLSSATTKMASAALTRLQAGDAMMALRAAHSAGN